MSRSEVRPEHARRALILVENASVPFDRRVTQEAFSLLRSGYTVSVICPAAPGQSHRESLEGVEVRRYRSRPSTGGALSQGIEYLTALTKTFWLMLRLARDPGFDVIQACNPPDFFFVIAWPFKLAGKRFIFDQHDLSPELYSALFGRERGFIMRVLRWAERRTYALSDAVIACNESYRHIATTRGRVGADRVFVVRNGPREGWPRQVVPDSTLKRGRPFLVTYVGVMGYQDGVDVLIRAVDVLVHERGFHDATFAVVGHGSADDALQKMTSGMGLDEYVYFPGWIKDEQRLSSYLVTADVCVSPEPSSPLNDHSTFIKVMEYMASGTPIVAFDLPETRFSAGDAAVYATPGDVVGFADRILQVLTDGELQTRMIACAARRTPSLRWERQVPSLLGAYDRAFDSRRTPQQR